MLHLKKSNTNELVYGGYMKEYFMNYAISLAKKGIGFVNPGPLRGAVLVKDNKIIGEGNLPSYLGQQPELLAMDSINEVLSDSELYTVIEPSEEAVLEIIKRKVKIVYIGIPDLGIYKKEASIKALEAAGIKVITGILKEECTELNEIYSHYITKGTPFVFTKWAMTLDGKLATKTGDSKWISGDESLKFVHELRQRVAAIMVGENTVRVDNPMLTTRLEDVKISNPVRIILSKYGSVPDTSKILEVTEDTKTIFIVSENISKEREEFLIKKNVELIKLKEFEGRLSFQDIIKALGDRNLDSLYIEGGSEVLASAFESKVVNKVYAAIAPKIIGGRSAITAVAGVGIERMKDAIILKRVTHEIVGVDVIFKGYIE